MPWGDYGWGMGHGWGMGFGWVFMIVFWVFVILGVIFLIRIISGSAKKEETALDILKKRYARGDINKEAYDRMRDDLLKQGP